MIIKTLILTTLLNSDYLAIVQMPPSVKIEASRKRGKGNRGKRRGGGGLR